MCKIWNKNSQPIWKKKHQKTSGPVGFFLLTLYIQYTQGNPLKAFLSKRILKGL